MRRKKTIWNAFHVCCCLAVLPQIVYVNNRRYLAKNAIYSLEYIENIQNWPHCHGGGERIITSIIFKGAKIFNRSSKI